jgi:hypothetical protein
MSFKDLLDEKTRKSVDVIEELMKKNPEELELTSEEFQQVLGHGQTMLDGFNKIFEDYKEKK